MSVPAIAFYASPPAAVCSTDFDPVARAASASSGPPSTSFCGPKPFSGGLSRIFASSSPTVRVGEELGVSDELAGSYSYSSYLSSSFKGRGRSPVSVFHGPVSTGSCSSRSPSPHWISVNWRANALRPYVDFDSPSFPGRTAGRRGELQELPFEFDEGEIEIKENCAPYAINLLVEAQSRQTVFCEEIVVKAFFEAEKAHRGQMRESGDPYLRHCVETAVLLASIGANTTIVAAGLLHDTLDDSLMDYDNILQVFGAGVAGLVEGVSKLSHLSQLARDNDTAGRTIEADRLHTMFLAMTDARAVLIKLADRLHNMMTLEALSMEKQQRFAKETLEIFVPLASRLGISTWKDQLENLCFKHLQPVMYQSLSQQLLTSSSDALVASAVEKLEKVLKEEDVSYHALSGRKKSLYSVYSKMLKKKLNIDQIHDIRGLRLIVDKKEDCYKALDVVHRLWPNVIGKYKDYISCPKPNGYQSLHTVVLMEDMHPLEVQIRTKEMHLHSEYGFAAHWRYKEGECEHSSYVLQMVEWARWVLSWQCKRMDNELAHSLGDTSLIRPPCQFPSHSDDCPYLYVNQCTNNTVPIYVVVVENDKMSVEEFIGETTVNDLMERVGGCSKWSGNNFTTKLELRPRLNDKPVIDPSQKLKMGDVVELTADLTDESLTEYREEIRRMYDFPASLSNSGSWVS